MIYILFLIILQVGLLWIRVSAECPPLPFVEVENGRILRTGHYRYTFRCNDGYFLASSSRIRCYKGNWTSSAEPKCVRKEGICDEPPSVDNAVVLGDDRTVDSTIRYACKPGFILLGPADHRCSQNGHWVGRLPTCMDENEPLEKVGQRLKTSFVTEMANHTSGAQGRSLSANELLLGLELVLLIDRSSSVDPIHLEDGKSFVKFLLTNLGVRNGGQNRDGTRAAVLAFGTDVQMVFNLDNRNITGPLAANMAIDTIQPNGGGTNMEGAFLEVLEKVIPDLRPRAKKALFLMTDGEPNVINPQLTPQDLAQVLKNVGGFEIFTVGIGKGINRKLLAELASEPPLSHVFILTEYPDLNEVMKIIQEDKPKAPPISPHQCGHIRKKKSRPWSATVYLGGESIKICSGVLICYQWVLTAASCLQTENQPINIHNVFISLGERMLQKDERSQTNFYATDIRIHPAFDSNNSLENNLALIKLNYPASEYIPACLPPTDRVIPLHLDLNINTTIAGWGLTSVNGPTPVTAANINLTISATSVSLAEEDKCPGKRRDMPLFCAGRGIQTCIGLAGSPLIAIDPATDFFHVLGIVSGRQHCLRGHNQYVELTKYFKWINKETMECHLKHWGIN